VDVKLVLGAVERALAGRELVRQAVIAERVGERLLGDVPHLVVAHPLVGPRGELDVDLLELEGLVDAVEEAEEIADLAPELVFGAEGAAAAGADRRRGRGPGAAPAALEGVRRAEAGAPPRQLAVAPPPLREDEAVARAVHRLEAEPLELRFLVPRVRVPVPLL